MGGLMCKHCKHCLCPQLFKWWFSVQLQEPGWVAGHFAETHIAMGIP